MSPLSVDEVLRGAPEAAAIGFPDGRRVSYAGLRAAVLARDVQRPFMRLPAEPFEALVAALAAWHRGAVAVPNAPPALPAEVDPRAALLLFTSGSTGGPKGVLLSAEGLRANVDAILSYLPVREVPDTALVLPLHYSYALVGQALTTLRAGGTLWLLGSLEYPNQKLVAMAAIGRPVGLSSVPASLRLLAGAELEQKSGARLGYVASAGGHLAAPVIARVRQAFGQVRFFNQYGLTEASPRVTAVSDEHPAFAFGSVGRPLPGLSVFAVGPSGERLPTDASGELAVRGPSVMLGYLGDAAATARVLSVDGVLRTGDFGHVDRDGFVFVEGRRDGVVKVAGERVSLEGIADAFRGVAGVREVTVAALPDEALGARLVAVVEGAVDLKTLRARGRELPPQQRPTRYVIVDVMPRTANGKIDFVAVRTLAEGGA
ncbi:MAG: acyl--CoA ligase [Myxococcaceae bacterium]|nr:acyl--CoA ligase [Myxococcaceae bacterium]